MPKNLMKKLSLILPFTSCTFIKESTHKSLEIAKKMGGVIQESFADDDSMAGKMARESGKAAVEEASE